MTHRPHILEAIERYAEGLMAPHEAAAFETRMAEDSAFAEAVESHLAARDAFRAALRRVMKTVVAADLREQVVAALRDEAEHSAGVFSREQGRRSGSWFDGPQRANLFAVAASLMLVAGAVVFGIFGPRITDRPRGNSDTPVTEVAERMNAVHQRCSAQGTCGAQEEPWRSIEEAQAFMTRRLRRPLVVPDLESAGFSFCAGGPSCVPGACEHGAQLLYCRLQPGSDACSWLSVFVAPVETPYLAFDPFGRTGPLQCGIDYSMVTPAGDSMHYWCDGVVTWFVKTDGDVDFDAIRTLFPGG